MLLSPLRGGYGPRAVGLRCSPRLRVVLPLQTLQVCARLSENEFPQPRRSWSPPHAARLYYSTTRQNFNAQQPSCSTQEDNAHPEKVKVRALEDEQLSKHRATIHENIYTLPNLLTASRLIASPFLGWLILHDSYGWAVGLLGYAALSDLVDGYLARRYNLQTVVGTIIDPMADKTLMTILTVCLAIKGLLPVWLAVIILGRDGALGVAAIYFRWISLPPPKTFLRYWDFSLPSAEVHPTNISKINTALQLTLLASCTALPLLSPEILPAVSLLQYIVATTTVWSGLSYIYTKDAVKVLSRSSVEKDK